MTSAQIIVDYCAKMGAPADKVKSQSRRRDLFHHRAALSVILMRQGKKLAQIGRALGRNHATILHALHRAGYDKAIKALIAEYEANP